MRNDESPALVFDLLFLALPFSQSKTVYVKIDFNDKHIEINDLVIGVKRRVKSKDMDDSERSIPDFIYRLMFLCNFSRISNGFCCVSVLLIC